MKLNFTLGASAVAGLALLAAVASTPAEATHWRGGNISWTPSPTNANSITFEVTSYWRRSAFGAPNLGDSIGDPFGGFSFGDATSASASATVFSVNATNDWIGVTSSFTHTYASSSTFVASLGSCCRLSTLENNSDGSFRLETTVTVGGTDSSPDVGGSSPIFLVADGGVQMFNPFSLTDPDGGTHSFALASSAQAGPGFTQPTGLSIDSMTGIVTWDTGALSTAVGDLWSVSFLVTDNQGNTSPLDILLQICTPASQGCNDFQPPEQTVPAPATLSIAGLGLLGLAALRRRRKRAV